MGKNRVFFPQQVLDRWLARGRCRAGRRELDAQGRAASSIALVEGVRVLTEVSGSGDPYEITGKVKTVAFLTELGAELLGESMLIGDNAYEVVPGWLGSPVETKVAARRAAPAAGSASRRRTAVEQRRGAAGASFLARKL